jgi:hypothetical protein
MSRNRWWMGLSVLMCAVLLGGCDLGQTGGTKLSIFTGQTVAGNINSQSNESYVCPQTLLAVGGDPHNGYSWSCSKYPAGTTVTAGTGVFKSTGGSLVTGRQKFTMTVSDGTSTASADFTFTVVSIYPAWEIILQQMNVAEFDLGEATAGKPFGASLFAMGGTPPYTWSEDLSYNGRSDFDASGLVIDANDGIVRGTPLASASGNTLRFAVTVRDANGDVAGGNRGIDPIYSITVR